MTDIYLGILISFLVSAGAFLASERLARASSKAVWIMLGVAATVGVWAWIFWRDHPGLTRIAPFSNAIVLTNWLPICVAILLGIAWHRMRGKRWRKLLFLLPLVAVACYSAYGWLFVSVPPKALNLWEEDVALQTTPSSCSAASAATLLHHYHIQSTEQEMIDLCLTRSDGTSNLGIYRGLKLKTDGTPWRVEARRCSLEELRQLDGPAIVTVALPRAGNFDPRYERDWGWTRGQPHTVVVFGITPRDIVDVGEPGAGRERWGMKSLLDLWNGDVIRLVRR